MAQDRSVIVTVRDSAVPDIRGVADHLASEGLAVSRILPITGVIAGTAAADRLSALREVAGVSSVEEDVGVTLPPSNATIQ